MGPVVAWPEATRVGPVIRLPFTLIGPDGHAVADGTCAYEQVDNVLRVTDFRDLDGVEMELPPGHSYRVTLDPPGGSS